MAEHVYRFTEALEVWNHPLWVESARDDIDEYVRFVREETDLRLGIEADFIPGREERMRTLLEGRDWDYVVGSIHFLSDGALDYDKFDVWNSGRSPDHVWRTYFEWLGELAATGMYDILAHPDLVKHWGAGAPLAREGPALLLRHRDGADRRERDRHRGLDRRAAQAGRRDLPRPRVPGDGRSTPATRSRCPPTPTRPSSSASSTSARSSSSTTPASRSSACSTGASAGWSRSDERPLGHRLGLAPPRVRGAG